MKQSLSTLLLVLGLIVTAEAQFNIPLLFTGGGGPGNTEYCGLDVITFTADPIPAGLTYQWRTEYISGSCGPSGSVILGTSQVLYVTQRTDAIICEALDSTNQVVGNSWLIPVTNADFNGGICSTPSGSVVNICSDDSVWMKIANATWSAAIGSNPPGVVQWQKNGVDIPGATSESYYATTPGTYRLKFTVYCGSGYSNDIQVNITNLVPQISGITAICNGSSTTLCATASGGTAPFAYFWSTGEMTSCINASVAGSYTVTVTDANGCSGTATTVVTAAPNPVVNLGPDVSICQGNCVILNASGGITYMWNNGSTAQNITVCTSGVYSVIVADMNGCTGTDDVMITVNPAPVPVATANGPASFCQGDSVQLTVGGSFPGYQWFRYLNQVATVPSFYVGIPGVYHCMVTDLNGCMGNSNNITVTVPCIPIDPADEKTAFTGNGVADMVVFPNPADENVIVQLSNSIAGPFQITLMDNTGRIVLSQTENNAEFTLQLNSIAQGFYSLEIRSQNNRFVKPLLVK